MYDVRISSRRASQPAAWSDQRLRLSARKSSGTATRATTLADGPRRALEHEAPHRVAPQGLVRAADAAQEAAVRRRDDPVADRRDEHEHERDAADPDRPHADLDARVVRRRRRRGPASPGRAGGRPAARSSVTPSTITPPSLIAMAGIASRTCCAERLNSSRSCSIRPNRRQKARRPQDGAVGRERGGGIDAWCSAT